MSYCTSCGYKVEKEYKYCPNCGNELNLPLREENKGAVVLCKNCGEENPASAFECNSCGAALKKGKPDRKKGRNEKKKTAKPAENTAQKSLDLTKLIAIFAGVVGIALILVISGIFDDPVSTVTTGGNTNQAPSSGVDLTAVQQINDLEKKVQADPGNMYLLLELAHLKNDSGFYEKAIADYKKYLEGNPSNADVRIDMGVCYYNLKQYDTAILEMKKALEYQPDHQIGHLNLGIVNLAAGRMEESKSWLEKAVALSPTSEVGLRAKELLMNH